MSGLWTPDGEREVPRAAGGPPAAGGSEEDFGEVDEVPGETPGDMADLEAELLAAPVADVVANHCYGLFQLAALHLGQRPPTLEAARLATDAFGVLVEGLGERLGENEPTLRDGLAQLRLAYVQIAAAHEVADLGEPPA